jgi:hypothetical protein
MPAPPHGGPLETIEAHGSTDHLPLSLLSTCVRCEAHE